MKKLVSLLSCLLLIGCGEKSSSEGSQSTGENPTPSNDSAEPSVDVEKPPPAESAVAESPSGEPSESPNSLSDADVERLLKEAVDFESLEERDGLVYQNNEPFSGWIKGTSYLGQGQGLIQCKNGKAHGIQMGWRENGQKMYESTYKDGELISEKWWNAKGEEVETREEAETDTAQSSQETSSVEAAKEEVEATSSGPEPLISDADVERFAKDAMDSLAGGTPDDYTGWSKIVDRGQLVELVQWKNGEPDGPSMLWNLDGTILEMAINKEGETVEHQTYYPTGEKFSEISHNDDGLREMFAWHKNGKKAGTGIMKDGEPVMKFWDDKGLELDQEEGMKMMDQLQNQLRD